jgi:hypothetical protein
MQTAEEVHAQIFFKYLDLPTHGCLGYPKLLRRRRETLEARGRLERNQSIRRR